MHICKKLTSLGAAAVLTLGLAACGGGGSPAPIAPQPKPVDLGKVTPGYGTLTAGETELDAGGTTTNGNVTFTCAADAGADGCTVIVADGNKVTYTGGMVTAANSAAYAKKVKADNDARLADAKAIFDALRAAPGTSFDPGNDGDGVTVTGGEVTDTNETKYAKSSSDTAPAIAGWKGSVWTKENTTDTGDDAVTTTQTILVYTDKGASTDTDYLDFGHWVRKISGGDNAGYTVEAFFRGSLPYFGVDGLEGSVTYGGSAAGLYSRQIYNPDGTAADRSAGRFTASASLTANFGGGAIPANDHYMISGTISDFRDAAGKSIDGSWSVALKKIQRDSQNQTWGDTFDGGATDGGGAAAGTWRGAFYGDNTQDSQGNTPLPTGVAGEFTAGFTNGEVVGAFGATRQ